MSVSASAKVIPSVPAYIWRHGCGPTAAGMVLGYWDGQGFDELVPGDARLQTDAVNAMIATEGVASNYTDYCLPLDDSYVNPTPLPDLSMDPPGDEHPDNCIADLMKSSQSRHYNYYGWSWFSHVGPALSSYVETMVGGGYRATVTSWTMYDGSSAWESYCAEIDAHRPMVFLVDSTGDGLTDHFVTAVGYDIQGDTRLYACLDTWDSRLHWYPFQPLGYGTPWGVFGAIGLRLAGTTTTIRINTNRTDAPWRLYGPQNYSGVGSEIIAGAPAGTYQMIWGEVDGCVLPLHQSQVLHEGEVIWFDGTFACSPVFTSYLPFVGYNGSSPAPGQTATWPSPPAHAF